VAAHLPAAQEFRLMLDIEAALATVQAELGIIPAAVAERICETAVTALGDN